MSAQKKRRLLSPEEIQMFLDQVSDNETLSELTEDSSSDSAVESETDEETIKAAVLDCV